MSKITSDDKKYVTEGLRIRDSGLATCLSGLRRDVLSVSRPVAPVVVNANIAKITGSNCATQRAA